MRAAVVVLLLVPSALAQSRWDPPGKLPHIESASEKQRVEIDRLITVMLDVDAGRDSLDASTKLATIGKAAFPRVLAAMARLTDTIGDEDTVAERLVESSLRLADQMLRKIDPYLDQKGKSSIRPGSEKRYIAYILRLHYKRWLHKIKGTARPDVSVHAIGVYEGGEARVIVREAAGPIVLVLTSYEATKWKISNPARANIRKIIVSGYHASTVLGASDDTEVSITSHDSGDRKYFYWSESSPNKRHKLFEYWQKYRVRYDAFVEHVKRVTGKTPDTVQGRYSTSDFEVRTGRKPGDCDVHAIGVYEADRGVAHVRVEPTAKPAYLVLTAYESVEWRITLAKGAKVAGVILGSYKDQRVTGLPPGTPVLERGFWARDQGNRIKHLDWAVRRVTGQPVKTFQTTYKGAVFVVK